MIDTDNLVITYKVTVYFLDTINFISVVNNIVEVDEDGGQAKLNKKYTECKFIMLNKALA